MTTKTLNPAEIRKLGIEALIKSLGPVGMAQFMQLFESGEGDYTLEKNNIESDENINDIIGNIKKRRINRND